MGKSIGIAAAILIAALIGTDLWAPASVGAESGQLVFMATSSRPGAPVAIRYSGPTVPGTPRQLVVRGRVRRAGDDRRNDEIPVTRVATLVRDTKGKYRGEFRLPNDVVYLVAAVDDLSGWTDDHGGRLWELLSPDAAHEYAARMQQVQDVRERDWATAHQFARQLVRDFPDSAVAWRQLLGFDRRLPSSDSLRVMHQAAFERVERLYRGKPNLSPGQTADIFYYAWAFFGVAINADTTGLPPAMQFWRRRVLQADNQVADIADLQYTLAASSVPWADQRGLMTLVEQFWDAHPVLRNRSLASEGIRTARRLGDAAALVRWERRLAMVEPSRVFSIAQILARDSMTWQAGVPMLDSLLAGSAFVDDEGPWRPLERNRMQFRQDQAVTLSRAWLALATGKLRGNDTTGARLALMQAGALGWDAKVQRQLAETWLSRGDTLRALQAFASVSVDPLLAEGVADSLWRLFGGRRPRAMWDSLRAVGALRMERAVMTELRPIRVGGPATVVSQSTGQEVSLSSLTAGPNRALVVVFWSTHCEPSVSALPQLGEIAGLLGARGISLVPVALERDGSEAVLRAAHLSLPSFDDRHRRLRNAVGQWMTPQAFIFSGDAGVAFEFTGDLDGLARAALVVAARTRSKG